MPRSTATAAPFRSAVVSAAAMGGREAPASHGTEPSVTRQQPGSFRRSAASWAHIRRCRAAGPPPGEAEVARLVAEFHARGGTVAVCPPVHLLPVQNGTGRGDAAPSRRPG